jgi:hypothetical protein
MKLKTKIVTAGWEGSDTLAIEFPVELAMHGFNLCHEAISMGKRGILNKLNAPSVNMLMSFCLDIIENSTNKENTYVLDWMFADQVREMAKIEKVLKRPIHSDRP